VHMIRMSPNAITSESSSFFMHGANGWKLENSDFAYSNTMY